MRKITTLLLVALLVNLANAQVQQADIWKKAADNPTLVIEAFNGDAIARQKLERMFTISGWFHVLPQDQQEPEKDFADKADFDFERGDTLENSSKRHSAF